MSDGRQRLRRRLSAQAELAPALPGIPDERLRWALHSACFTPRAVARQGLERLRAMVCPRPWVLDIGAGGGVFGQVAREVLTPEHLVAVEPREEERANLQRHYQEIHVLDAAAFAAEWTYAGRYPRFDLVASNPPWDLWGECWSAAWSVLEDGGVLALLGPSTWGHSDESSERIDLFEAEPPTEQWRIRGRIAFNGGTATDNRKCSWWVWVKGAPRDHDGAWRCLTLPALPASDRCWRVRPGTEP